MVLLARKGGEEKIQQAGKTKKKKSSHPDFRMRKVGQTQVPESRERLNCVLVLELQKKKVPLGPLVPILRRAPTCVDTVRYGYGDTWVLTADASMGILPYKVCSNFTFPRFWARYLDMAQGCA